MRFNDGNIGDAIAQARFLVNSGVARLAMRHSGEGEYAVHLGADGQVGLYRGTTLLGTASVAGNTWHSVQLGAISGLVTVTIDDIQLISIDDPSPLPSGMIYFSNVAGNSDFWVDEFALSAVQETAPSLYASPESVILTNQSVSALAGGQPNLIAFNTTRNENNDIYLMNSDGSDQIPLVTDPGFNAEPAWSPDGTRIAFVSGRHGNEELYVINADGSNLLRLTFDTSAADREPSWSPDGSSIAFSKNGGLCLFSLPTSLEACVPSLSSGNAYSPDWSPDGTTILYNDWSGGISKFNLQSGAIQPITANAVDPAWSPDGSQIAYISSNPGGIWVYNVASQVRRQITPDGNFVDGNPDWSADGSQLVFDSRRFGPFAEVYTVPASGNPTTVWVNLSNHPAVDFEPVWSPSLLPYLTPTPLPIELTQTAQAQATQTAQATRIPSDDCNGTNFINRGGINPHEIDIADRVQGHTLRDHVDVTTQDLLGRLKDNPSHTGVGRFFDEDTANQLIEAALDQLKDTICDWLNNNPYDAPRDYREKRFTTHDLESDGFDNTEILNRRGNEIYQDQATEVKLLVSNVPNPNGSPFTIITGYPEFPLRDGGTLLGILSELFPC